MYPDPDGQKTYRSGLGPGIGPGSATVSEVWVSIRIRHRCDAEIPLHNKDELVILKLEGCWKRFALLEAQHLSLESSATKTHFFSQTENRKSKMNKPIVKKAGSGSGV